MKHANRGLVLLLAAFAASPVFAGSLVDAETAYGQGEYATALETYRNLADQGNAEAQNNLGVMYREGRGVARDPIASVAWLRRAAEQGYLEAQVNLGLMYARGHGVPRDDAEAVRWYRKAAEQGYAWAETNIGYMYAQGRGVPRNDAEAVQWYRKATAQGFAMAQDNLGVMYRDGRGVARSYVEAVEWFRLAAAQGNAEGQNNLGVMYARGAGVLKDDAEALRWYRKAAEQGLARAQLNLGEMYGDGRGTSRDDAEAARWNRLAAEQGNAEAQQRLGVMYRDGRGVPQDLAAAKEWLGKAAAQGGQDAKAILATIEDEQVRSTLSRRIAELVKTHEAGQPPMPEADSERMALARDIVSTSRAREMLSNMPKSFDRDVARQAASTGRTSPKVWEAIGDAFVASFQPDAVLRLMEQKLALDVDAATLRVGLEWEQSDLGRRFNRLDVDAYTQERVAARKALALQFVNRGTPPDDPRARTCSQVDTLEGKTDAELPFAEAVVAAVAMPAMMTQNRPLDMEELKRAFVALRPLLREAVRQSTLVYCMTEYRELSDADLARWLEFLGTDGGGRYARGVNAAMRDAMLLRTEVFARTLFEVMRGFKREAESS